LIFKKIKKMPEAIANRVEVKTSFFSEFKKALMPNKAMSRRNYTIMVALQIAIAIMFWLSTNALIPKPIEVWNSFKTLVQTEGLIQELMTSTKLGLAALIRTIILSLLLSYLTVLPLFRPAGFIVSKLRFLTLVGLSFVFTIYTSSGHDLKIALLVFGMSVFFVPGAINVVNNVSRNALNHARTLRMNEWEVVFRTQIIGTMDTMFELIRQNFAIAWMMLTMVEGIVRSEGGAGALLLNQNKHLHLDSVFAIQFSILLIGIGIDYTIGVLKNLLFPHARLEMDRK